MTDKSEKPNLNYDLIHLDRLSSMLTSFSLRVEQCANEEANLLFLSDEPGGYVQSIEVLNTPDEEWLACNSQPVLFAARAWLGDGVHPLFKSLPPHTSLQTFQQTDLCALVRVLINEVNAQRCGVQSVVNRLVEIVFVQVLRSLMESGLSSPGMLNGLSDPKLSRAMVAIHTDPMHPWTNNELADEACFSISRFIEVFREKTGSTPAAYLREWRLILALQDIRNGARVNEVAKQYSYSSGESLTRAFKKNFGYAPSKMR